MSARRFDYFFHSVSEDIKKWMIKQPHVKEESLTDWLLYNVSETCPYVYYQAFSRHEEVTNGADWEWWVLTQDCISSFNAYRFLVQAKKTTKNGDNYSRINYSNKNGFQIDLLMQHAKTLNAFPLYMFYATSEPDIAEQDKNIPFLDSHTLAWCSACENGCFLSDANSIYHLLFGTKRSKISEIAVLNHSFKLSLLDLLLRNNISERDEILSRFNSEVVLSKSPSHVFPSGVRGIKHFGEGIPNYLSVFINSQIRDLSWFESEMRRDIPDVGGIGVIDLRGAE